MATDPARTEDDLNFNPALHQRRTDATQAVDANNPDPLKVAHDFASCGQFPPPQPPPPKFEGDTAAYGVPRRPLPLGHSYEQTLKMTSAGTKAAMATAPPTIRTAAGSENGSNEDEPWADPLPADAGETYRANWGTTGRDGRVFAARDRLS